VLLLGLVLRLFAEGFSSLSGLDGRERGGPFSEYSGAELSTKLCRITMGSMHAPTIKEMITKNPTADSDANITGKRDTRPLKIREAHTIMIESRLTEFHDEQQDLGRMRIQCLFRALHRCLSLSSDPGVRFQQQQ